MFVFVVASSLAGKAAVITGLWLCFGADLSFYIRQALARLQIQWILTLNDTQVGCHHAALQLFALTYTFHPQIGDIRTDWLALSHDEVAVHP